MGVMMDISVNRLLDKIGEELTAAKRIGSAAKIRERAQAIKAICELILDESSQTAPISQVSRETQIHRVEVMPASQPVLGMLPQQKRLKMDEANGDSIFDF